MRCKHCAGNGFIYMPCPICNGRGIKAVKDKDDQLVHIHCPKKVQKECEYCEGSGISPNWKVPKPREQRHKKPKRPKFIRRVRGRI